MQGREDSDHLHTADHDSNLPEDAGLDLSSGTHAAAADPLLAETSADGAPVASPSEGAAITLIADLDGGTGNDPASLSNDGAHHLVVPDACEGLGPSYGLQNPVDALGLMSDHDAPTMVSQAFAFNDRSSVSFVAANLVSVQPAGPSGAFVVADLGITPGHNDTLINAAADATNPVGEMTGPILFGGDSHSSNTSTSTTTTSSSSSSTTTMTSGGSSSAGLVINVTYDASVNNAPSGFTADVAAVVQWFEKTFTNPVTINIDVGYGEVNGQSMGSGALGESLYYINSYSYSQVKNALSGDNLPSTDPTNGGTFWVSTAEAKAIGLASGSSVDGYVGFGSASNLFAYTDSNGVPVGQYDFMGTVAHEISEVLGRYTLDGSSINSTKAYSPLDLFHFSAPGVHDLSGTTAGYFSADNGATSLDNFNTYSRGDFGDWAGSVGNDAFLAFAPSGVLLPVTTNDVSEMATLGWKVASTSSTSSTAVTTIAETPGTGDLGAGKSATLTLSMSGVVTVAGGTPTLTLNDGGTAVYVSGSGTDALSFAYTVASTDHNVSALAATAVNLSGATITDSSGSTVNLSLSGLTQVGPQIDTSTPTLTAILETPSAGVERLGSQVTVTLDVSEAVTVAGGTMTLTLNDGGTATYDAAHSTSTALVFDYTVASSDHNVSSLAATSINFNGATVTDGAANLASLSLNGLTQAGPGIDVTIPAVMQVSATPSTELEAAGSVATITLTMNEAVNVSGGSPTLLLNDGGVASFDAAHSTSTNLVFDYTVANAQYTQALAVTGVSLNGATVSDAFGGLANFSGALTTFSGLQVDATTPTASSDRAHEVLGTTMSVAANVGVLANDKDADPYDTLSVSAVNGLATSVGHSIAGNYGNLTLNADGSYGYIETNMLLPAGGVAQDIFTYTTSNGHGGTATTTLTLVITAANQAYMGGTAGSTIQGGSGHYVLDGGAGNNTVNAGSQSQVLIGGAGDTLNGASKYADTFVFGPKLGIETVTGFNANLDLIELPKTEFPSFGAVMADAHQSGNSTIITLDAQDSITLSHVQLTGLHASNFAFV
jgi:VCBS repeat-containing protein